MGPDGNIRIKTRVVVNGRRGFYAGSAQYAWICTKALDAGLGEKLARDISHGNEWGGLSALDAALAEHPGQANAIADIRARILEEEQRLKKSDARRSREYRARKRQQRVAGDERACPICTKPIKGKRADAVACSDKCRVRFHRQQSQLRYLAMDPNMDRFKPGPRASIMDCRDDGMDDG